MPVVLAYGQTCAAFSLSVAAVEAQCAGGGGSPSAGGRGAVEKARCACQVEPASKQHSEFLLRFPFLKDCKLNYKHCLLSQQ